MSCRVTVDRSVDVLPRTGERSRSISSWAEVVRTGGGDDPGGEQVEEAVGLEGDDLTADRELAEQQRGSLFAVAGVDGAEDLGSPRGQLHPGGVRMLRQSGGHGRRRPRSTADADGPVGPAEPLGVELADDPHDAAVEQAPVAAGDGLLGGSEDLGQPAERRPGVDVESLDDSSVQSQSRVTDPTPNPG